MSNINQSSERNEMNSMVSGNNIDIISKFSAIIKDKNNFKSVRLQGQIYFKNKYNRNNKSDLGNLLMAANDYSIGDPLSSLKRLRFIIKNDPKCSSAHNLYIKIVLKIGQNKLIENALKDAVRYIPNNHSFLSMWGKHLLFDGKKFEALEYLEKSVEMNPQDCSYWIDLGFCYYITRNIKMATLCLETAKKINPNHLRCLNFAPLLFQEESKYDEAIKIHEYALNLYPGDNAIITDLAMLYLKVGKKKEGYKLYHSIKPSRRSNFYKLIDIKKTSFKKNHIKAIEAIEDLNKTHLSVSKKYRILVFLEQGCGDILNFYRFLDPLIKKGHSITVLTHQKPMIPLLKFYVQSEKINLLSEIKYEDIKSFQYKTFILNIPHLLNIEKKPPPPILFYLKELKKNKKNLVTRLRKFLSTKKKNIGVSWKGNKRHLYDESRSIDLKLFSKIFENKKNNFFIIDKEISNKERTFLSKFNNIVFCDELISDWSDTAVIVSELDEVISVDTSLAHISGTLNKPTQILIAKDPDWRWGLKGMQTEWYKSVRLKRQANPDNWTDVMTSLCDELK